MRTIHEDATMTAKRCRAILKKNWPAVKFSVRSSKYSGGSSVHIAWVDGPMSDLVDAKVKGLEGADFDAMIDLKSYTGFLAMEGDEMVKIIGADYIFIERRRSPGLDAKLRQQLAEKMTNPSSDLAADLVQREYYWLNETERGTFGGLVEIKE